MNFTVFKLYFKKTDKISDKETFYKKKNKTKEEGSEEVEFKLRPEGWVEMSQLKDWRKNV